MLFCRTATDGQGSSDCPEEHPWIWRGSPRVLFRAVWRALAICSSATEQHRNKKFSFNNRVLQLIEKLYLKELKQINNAPQK